MKLQRKKSIFLLALLTMGAVGIFAALAQAANSAAFSALPEPRNLATTANRLFAMSGFSCQNHKIYAFESDGVPEEFARVPNPAAVDPNCPEPRYSQPPNTLEISEFDDYGPAFLYVARSRAIYKVDPGDGQVSDFVQFPPAAGEITAITFDEVGTFGHRLLVTHTGVNGGYGAISAVSPNRDVKLITELRTASAGNDLAVAPQTFGRYGGHLIFVTDRMSESGSPASVCSEWEICTVSPDPAHVIERMQTPPDLQNIHHIDFVPKAVCTLGSSGGAFFSAVHGANQIQKFPHGDFTSLANTALISDRSRTLAIRPQEGSYSFSTFHEYQPGTDAKSGAFAACSDQVSVSSVAVPEGNSGTGVADFRLSLIAPNRRPVSIHYSTREELIPVGQAISGADYVPAEGDLTFAPGETTKVLHVKVIGDTQIEPDETFTLALSKPGEPEEVTAEGVGTILDDDLPSLAVPEIVPPALEQPSIPAAEGQGGSSPPQPPPSSLTPHVSPGSAGPSIGGTAPQGAQPPPAPPSGASAPGPSVVPVQAAAPGSPPVTASEGSLTPLYAPVPGAAPPVAVAGQGTPVAIPGMNVQKQEPQAAPEGDWAMVRNTSHEASTGSFLAGASLMLICGLAASGGQKPERRLFGPVKRQSGMNEAGSPACAYAGGAPISTRGA